MVTRVRAWLTWETKLSDRSNLPSTLFFLHKDDVKEIMLKGEFDRPDSLVFQASAWKVSGPSFKF